MQINFNPHLPPGYLETHELGGACWRSEKPVREALDEISVARAVRRFERDSNQEMEQQRRARICTTIRKTYKIKEITLEIVRYPWERIPSVIVSRKRPRER